MRRVIPDWMRCINCYTFARSGKIEHKRTCPSYRPPNTVTATQVRIGDLLGGRR